jgi:hypothetical protein
LCKIGFLKANRLAIEKILIGVRHANLFSLLVDLFKHWIRGTITYRKLRRRGLCEVVADKVPSNGRRWWRNSVMAINIAFPVRYFDELGLPQLTA